MRTDTLEAAQKEGRAPWTDVELTTTDFVVFKDDANASYCIFPYKGNRCSVLLSGNKTLFSFNVRENFCSLWQEMNSCKWRWM